MGTNRPRAGTLQRVPDGINPGGGPEPARNIARFLDAVPVGLLVVDQALRVVAINRLMTTLAEHPERKWIGGAIRNFSSGLAAPLHAALQKIFAGEPAEGFEWTQPAPDARRFQMMLTPVAASGDAVEAAPGQEIDAVICAAIEITAQQRALAALQETARDYREAMELKPQVAWTTDANGRLLRGSPRWEELTGTVIGSGRGWVQTIHPHDLEPARILWARAIETGSPFEAEYRLRMTDGTYRWFRACGAARRDEAGEVLRWYGIWEDVHDRVTAVEALRESDAFARGVLESSLDAITVLDLDYRIIFMNETGLRLLGAELAAIAGQNWMQIVPQVIDDAAALLDAARAGEIKRQAVRGQTAEGKLRCWDAVFSPIRGHDGAVKQLLLTARDVTEREEMEQRTVYLAGHDPLTDLPNRRLFQETLEQAFAARTEEECLALHGLDLDQFKGINDTMGHAAGDQLLKSVAERLRAHLPAEASLARIGGDEFAVIQPKAASREAANALAEALVKALDAPFAIDEQQVVAGASLGVALAPQDGKTPDELVKNMDIALYRAKSEGRGTCRFFDRRMDQAVRERQDLRLRLRSALAAQELELHFQPQVDLRQDEVTCLEALLRWHHPARGTLSTGEWIPVAEETGLIAPIGEWALHEACRQAMGWPAPLRVAVNLSPVQFRSAWLQGAVASALAISGLPADRLELEITESVLLQDDEANLATLRQLRALGVRIVLDDFGTGYSSLGYLLKFPFNKIKIDLSFVAGLPEHEESRAIVEAILGLGQSLKIAVAAEGVETPGQLSLLRRKGCAEAQGYLFSRPVPGAEVAAMLHRLDSVAGFVGGSY